MIHPNEEIMDQIRLEGGRLNELIPEALPFVAVVLRSDRRILVSNRRARELGVAAGMTCHEAWQHRQDACPWCRLEDCVFGGAMQTSQFEAHGRWWEAYWVPLDTDRVLHFAQDITRYKDDERAADQARRHLQAVIDSVPSYIFLKDRKNRCLMANRAMAESLGRSPAEMKGTSLNDLFPAEQDRPYGDDDRVVIKTGRPRTGIIEKGPEINGAEAWFSTDKVPLLDETGDVVGVVGVATNITEQKQTLDALRRARNDLERAEELGGFGNWTWDLERDEMHWSDALFRLLGREARPEPLTYHDLLAHLHPADRSSFEEVTRKVLASRGPFKRNYRIHRTDGALRYLEERGEVQTGDFDRPFVVFGTVQDVTERYKLTQRLRESEERHRISIEYAADGFALTRDGGIVACNRAFVAMFGYETFPEVIGASIEKFVHAADRARVMKQYRRRMDGDDAERRYEFRGLRKDGSGFDVEVSTARTRFQGKDVNLANLRDITKRKQAEEALRRSEERYRRLFETAADGVLHVRMAAAGPIATVIDCNARALELFGCRREALIGKNPITELSPAVQPGGQTSLEAVAPFLERLKRGETVNFDWVHCRLDGTTFETELSLVPVPDEGGFFVQAVVRDVTMKRRMEEKLRKTRALESLGTLAGGIAHDFNNLLMAVFGNIELARLHGDPTGRSHRLLAEAMKATERARHLAGQLLTFSKGGAPVRKRVALGSWLRETSEFVLSGSPVGFSLVLEDGLWDVAADAFQIDQVIHNIVRNAREALPDGGALEVRARNRTLGEGDKNRVLPPGRYVAISFRDDGPGMDEATAARVFDPYFTTKGMGEEKGRGLGLSICYSIVSKHGGLLEVLSEADQGTEFQVTLPAFAGPSVSPGDKAIGERDAPPLPSRRILVLEDEASVIQVLGEMLEVVGCEAVFEKSCKAAVERYVRSVESATPFDAVILDLTIKGGRGGVEAAKQLHEADPSVKAVLASGYTHDPVMSSFREYGFCAAIQKPFSIARLKETLHAVLGPGT